MPPVTPPAPPPLLDSPHMLRLLSKAGIGVFRHGFDREGRLVDRDRDPDHPTALPAELFGTGGEGAPSLHEVLQYCPPGAWQAALAGIEREAAAGTDHWEADFEMHPPSQKLRAMRLCATVLRDAQGRPRYLDGTFCDVTAKLQAQQELRKLQEALQMAMEASGAAMFGHPLQLDSRPGTDPTRRAEAWTINMEPMFGYPKGRLITDVEIAERMLPEDLLAVQAARQAAMSGGVDYFETEARLRLPDGSLRWVLGKTKMMHPRREGDPGYLTGLLLDITERKQAEERIAHLATHDTLTGLPNRAMCSELVQRAAEDHRRYDRPFALIFVDLDRFKSVNDTLGHEAGDELIRQLAQRFRKVLRASDMVARLGGDEFVIMAGDCGTPEQASVVARQLLTAAIAPVMLGGQECRVTASIGIALCPSDAADEQTLMQHADIAMYHAKEEGKNNFQFYSSELNTETLERMTLEAALRTALERDEFSLNYQPKVDFEHNRITGCEALLRWESASLGSVSPMRFIPVAEETGLIVPIGRWVLHAACAQAAAWIHAGLPPVPMAVNVSARQFADNRLYDDIQDALQAAQLDPSLLEIELTEGMVMHNIDHAIRLLGAVKALGVRVAIDDFGTGYSSLAQIRRFPIDTLKVDRSFVRGIQGDAEGQAIAEAIIAMGHSLSLTVIAEGVETAEEAQFLRTRDCDEMQGYHFSRPLSAEAFTALMRRTSDALPSLEPRQKIK